MTFLLISFIAGVLTVLAPCILPLLPVVVGSSASGRSKATPYIIVASLGVSIILFTFLLKVSSLFITVPPEVWTYISGGILVLFGITLVFPNLWDTVPGMNKLSIGSNKVLGKGFKKKSFWGDVIVGAALGPIFSACSPTYFVILASVLPASFFLGTVYLLTYTIGLSLVLLLIAILGERFANRLTGLSNPDSWFKRGLGVFFVLLGILIISGYEKKLEVGILNAGFFDITKIEQKLLEKADPVSPVENSNENSFEQNENATTSATTTTATTSEQSSITNIAKNIVKKIAPKNPYKEIVNPSGFVNTNDQPIKIADYVGKKVILLDILTYSCINCQRTFPYVTAWYDKYKDDGLIVIGIHTPEFAFEKDKKNVEEAMARFGITFPVVLDNDYGTWNAYGNRYWPRKYLIDINGSIVYDHIGEGGYEETEQKIRELLAERSQVLGEQMKDNGALAATAIPKVAVTSQSPETYLGSARNQNFGNGQSGKSGEQTFTFPSTFEPNKLYLDGTWNIVPESATGVEDAKVGYRYKASDVYLVMSSLASAGTDIEVWQDGKLLTGSNAAGAGADVNASGIVHVKESRLYTLIHNAAPGEHVLELRVKGSDAVLYAFTFG